MIELVPYRESWTEDFAKIRRDLLSISGHRILRVDHVGSTAIPGMMAKDIMDVQVGVACFADVETFSAALENLGYDRIATIQQDHAPGHEFEECVAGWEKRFFKASPAHRTANLHVRLVTGKNFEFALLFRDYLRQHAEAARAYEQVKTRLAEALPHNLKAYALIKDPVCDLIFFMAKKWAAETHCDLLR